MELVALALKMIFTSRNFAQLCTWECADACSIMSSSNHETNPHISTNLCQVAESIVNSSWGIYRVDDDMKDILKVASDEALLFLRGDDESKMDCQRIINGHLYGYNEPSGAKYLFRAYCNSNEQPWPNEKLESVSTKLAGRLHSLLLDCWAAIERQTESSTKDIKRDDVSQTGCPLDYFLYHGKNSKAVNCSEHVDRGVLICICLSNVPGLELYSNGSWICPEEVDEGSLVCILAGQQLRQFSDIPACIHRVRNNLPKQRLSISYELRYPEA